MRLKFHLFTLSILFLLLNGCGPPERVIRPGGTEHLPLFHNRTMKYVEYNGGRETEYTMSMRYIGGGRVRIFPLTFSGVDRGYCEFISRGSQVVFATDRPRTALAPRRTLDEYRQLWLDEKALSGEAWTDEDVGTQTVFAGYESVSVPAGKFYDCWKMVVEAMPVLFDSLDARHTRGDLSDEEYARETEQAGWIVVRWFAPGVGLVKEQIGSSEHTRELVEVVNPGYGQTSQTTKDKTDTE